MRRKSSFTITSTVLGLKGAAKEVVLETTIHISVNGQIARFLVMMSKIVIRSRIITIYIGEKVRISAQCPVINGVNRDRLKSSGVNLPLKANRTKMLKTAAARSSTGSKCSMSLTSSSISRGRQPKQELQEMTPGEPTIRLMLRLALLRPLLAPKCPLN